MLGLAHLLLVAAAAAPPGGVVTLPAVGVGEAPPATVLRKLGELLSDSLRRAGVPEPAPQADPGQPMVEAGRAHYFDLKFAEALGSAQAALAHYQAHPEHLGDGARFLDAHLFAALALMELGREQEAQQQLSAALILRPQLHLLESEFSPTALSALERARDQTAKWARAPLTVSSSPAFARLQLDGSPAGETPLTLPSLAVGRHFLRLTKDGHLAHHQWVEVKPPGSSAEVTLIPSPVEALRQELFGAVARGEGSRVESLARRLAAESGMEAVVLLAATQGPERFLVSAARVPAEGPAGRACTTLSLDLVDAVMALDAVARVLAAGGAEGPLVVGQPPPEGALDFQQHYLGLRPPPAKLVLPLASPPPPLPAYRSGWFWAAAGVAAAVAGVGAYLLARPSPPAPGVLLIVSLPE